MQALKEAKIKKPLVSVSLLRAVRANIHKPSRKSTNSVGHGIMIDEVTGKATLNVSVFIFYILTCKTYEFQRLFGFMEYITLCWTLFVMAEIWCWFCGNYILFAGLLHLCS